MKDKTRSVLFVSTGNAGRSQIAEAMTKNLVPDNEVRSVGVDPRSELHPMAVKLMDERGIPLGEQ